MIACLANPILIDLIQRLAHKNEILEKGGDTTHRVTKKGKERLIMSNTNVFH